MQNTLDKINAVFTLPQAEVKQLMQLMEKVHIPKNQLLIDTSKVERYIYFIEQGIARAFSDTPKTQLTFWFGQEGDVVLSFNSYINNKPGYEKIEMLEDSILYRISNAKLQQLYLENTHLANWGRKFAEQELIKTEERLIDRQFNTAMERYEMLLRQNPTLLKRVKLNYIASYLGITQVSFSRIRAQVK